MKVLIIEDEPSNEKILRQLLEKVMPEADMIVSKESVRSSIEYLLECIPYPDLIFADIRLSDGLCFDIFDSVEIRSPVIFTTAYDSFALKAFEYNALSYLLKPVMEKDLRNAIEKASRFTAVLAVKETYRQMLDMSQGKAVYLNRILFECVEGLYPAEVSDICLLESDMRNVIVCLSDGRRGLVDRPLRYFEEVLDPGQFIRVSRQYIIAPSRVKVFRNLGHGRCEAVFHEKVGQTVEFPKEKLNEIKSMFGMH